MVKLRANLLWIPGILILLVGLLYYPVHHFDFVNYDDPAYFYENPHVMGGLTAENARWAFEIHGPSMWIPLTWLSHQAAVSLFGPEPGAHHSINAALHALNVCLLFWLLCRYTRAHWRAAIIAALFAVHPIHVESVAWITERKDVLAMTFVLATLLAYRAYTESGRWWQFALVGGLHACAVGAKPLAVTLPCVLLLLDFWPLGRLHDLKAGFRCALEKLPLLLISAFASYMTILCQLSIQAIGSLENFPLSTRLVNAVVNYATYLRKFVAPIDLVPFYPYAYERPLGEILVALLTLAAFSALAFFALRRHHRAPLVGWLWYLGTLVPMIGLVQAGSHAAADRYAYFPFIGLYILLAWTATHLCQRGRVPASIRVALALIPIGAFSLLSHRQIQVWANSRTLFEHTIGVSPNNYLAHNNLGLALKQEGALDPAVWHFKESIRINPGYTNALNNAGITAAENGDLTAAEKWLAQAIATDPKYATAFHNLAKVRFGQNQCQEAERLFQRAIQLQPIFPDAHYDLGCLFMDQERWPDALESFQTTLEQAPSHTNAMINAGVASSALARPEAARLYYQAALRVDPGNPLARKNLQSLNRPKPGRPTHLFEQAIKLRESGQYEASLSLFLRALDDDPSNPDLLNDAGVAFGLIKDHASALTFFNEALRFDPGHSLARRNRAAAEAALLQTSE